MTLRNQARGFVIRAANLFRADGFALSRQTQQVQAVVIAIHETPVELLPKFREQLEWASRHFTITSLEGFAELWDNPRPHLRGKPLLLYTFDDGRESNYTVAAPLLESFGGRGVFFIAPAFADCAGRKEAFDFYRERINPGLREGQEGAEDWRPMNPAQVADLAVRGHAIGNHTLTHQRLVGLTNQQLEREIGGSARKLADWTKTKIDAFAWTFGWDSIDASAWHIAQRYHRFCFSPCAGAIDGRSDQPSLLWRREVELRYTPAELRFSYSGLVDLWWKSRRKRLRRMLLEPRMR